MANSTSFIDMVVQASVKGVESVVTGLKSVEQAIARTEVATIKNTEMSGRAINRFSHNTGKDFGSISASMSPVLARFAEMAGAIYAVGFAYDKIALVAKFTQTKDAFGTLANTFNFNAELMVNKLKDLSNGTITAFEAMRAASVSAASGLSTKQMEELAVAAKNTSRAMGIDMSDAYQRITRGVTKLEPELLDELGLITRLQGELQSYAKEMGISADKVSSATKIHIFHSAVIKEATDKYGTLGAMEKSAAEELETMKNGLVDASLLFGEKFIPILVTTGKALASVSSYITILGAQFLVYKVQQTLAAAALKNKTIEDAKQIAALEAESLAVTTNTRLYTLNTASIVANTVATKTAMAARTVGSIVPSIGTTPAAGSKILDSVSGLSSVNKILDATTSKFGSLAKYGAAALGIFTGPIGVAITAVTLLANASGLLDGVWETLSGRASDLGSQVAKLNKEQAIAYDLLTKDGVEKLKAIEMAKNLANAFSNDLGNGLTTTTALLPSMKFGLAAITETMYQGSDGVQYYLNNIKQLTPQFAAVDKRLTKLRESLAVLREEQDKGGASWYQWGSIAKNANTRFEDAQKRVKAVEAEIQKLTESTAKLIDKQTGAADTGKAFATVMHADEKSVAQLAAATTFTIEQLDKLGTTPKSRLEENISNVDTQVTLLGNSLFTATEKAVALSGIDTDAGRKAYDNQVMVLQDLTDQYGAAQDAATRLAKVQLGKGRIKTLTAEIALLKSRSALEVAQASSIYAKSTATDSTSSVPAKELYSAQLSAIEDLYAEESKLLKLNKDAGLVTEKQYTAKVLNLYYAHSIKVLGIEDTLAKNIATSKQNLLDQIVNDNSAIASNDKYSYDIRLKATVEMYDAMLAKADLTTNQTIDLEFKKSKAIETMNDARIVREGSMWENLTMDARKYNDSVEGMGRTLATTFKTVASSISGTLIGEMGKAFGFIEDKAKTTFDAAVTAAQVSYASMVKAANDAFGLTGRDAALGSARSLEDIQTQRTRAIADLTAKRNQGGVDQVAFEQGLSDINTTATRATTDLGTSDTRGAEDAAITRQDSLLAAQEQLNAALLAADEQYAADKAAIWTDLYANIKSTIFTSLTDIAAQKAAAWAWEAAAESTFMTSLLGAKVATANAELQVDSSKSVAKAAIGAADTTAAYAPIPFVGLALAAGVIAAIYAAQPKATSVSAPTAPLAPKSPTKFHNGGLVTGSSQEVPITAYKGEGVLNSYNGMKAIGGAQGLNNANATGSLGTNSGTTNVTIKVVTPDGKETGTLTINNFEEFIRNKGSKQMLSASRDGVIMIDAKGIG